MARSSGSVSSSRSIKDLRIASRLLAYQLYGYDITYINNHNARVNAVTMDDIRRVAKLLPTSEEITFVVVGRPVGLDVAE